jgi:hypothetical protein
MAKGEKSFGGGYQPPRRRITSLKMCWGCRQHVQPTEETCPHCGADIAEQQRLRQVKLDEVMRWKETLEGILARLEERNASRAKAKKVSAKKPQKKKKRAPARAPGARRK